MKSGTMLSIGLKSLCNEVLLRRVEGGEMSASTC